MQRWLILLLITGSLAGLAAVPYLPSTVEFRNTSSDYRFGDYVTFQTEVEVSEQIKDAQLFLQPEGGETRLESLSIDPNGLLSYRYDLETHPLPPFARIQYWFRVTTQDGRETLSPATTFEYEDNRVAWQTLENEHFQVHWQTGDIAFGQAVANTAQAGLDSAQSILPAPVAYPLRVYVYSNPADLQSAFQLGQLRWVAGHASPETGVVVLSVAPGPDQELELERQLPHEMMHILQYIVAGNAYQQVPFWLSEGMASLAELYPNPDYGRVLENARTQQNVLAIETLCTGRPDQASSAFLAYAESASFVRFLQQSYGSSGLVNLIDQFRNGLGCTEAVQAAFGKSLSELDTQWRQTVLHEDVVKSAIANLSPYLLLLGLIVIVPLLAGFVLRQKKQKTA